MTGALLAVASAVTGAIRLFRMDWVQKILPSKFQWDNWPFLVQISAVFGLSVAGTAITAATGGQALLPALGTGIAAGLAAIGVHETTKGVGETQTALALKNDPDYQPGIVRQALDLVVPVDKDLLSNQQDPAKN